MIPANHLYKKDWRVFFVCEVRKTTPLKIFRQAVWIT